MRLGILTSVVVGVGLAAAACGGTDDGGLFNGGQAGQDAGIGGGTSGSGGATGGSGGATGGSGGATGGSGGGVSGSGGTAGVSGSGGDTGGTAGVSGSGGDTGGTAGVSGSGGDTGGTAGVSGSGGATGGSGGATGGTGGTTGPSCAGNCGSGQPVPGSNPACYCDQQCTSVGDCCPDYKAQCAPPGGSVHCGSQSCKLPGSYCCQNWNGSAYVPQCRDANQSCYGVDVECDGQSDCGSGQVCCGQLASGGNYYTEFSCRASTDCNVNQSRRIICGEQSECPSGLSCKQSNLLPAYNYCSSN